MAVLLSFPCVNAFAVLEGTLESADCAAIKGWAWDNASLAARVKLTIYDGNLKLATVTASLLRNDLTIGDKKYGFSYVLPASVRNTLKHKFSVRFAATNAELMSSPKITATGCYGKLNDTGMTTCSNATEKNLACPISVYPQQDAQSGRDVTKNNNSDGHAGFDFTKISKTGTALAATATSWNCVQDNVTGLMWEVKTDDNGLHDKDWSYTWYNPGNTKNGGAVGGTTGAYCGSTSACHTDAFVKAVNAVGWCGHKDWRVPDRDELFSIVDYSRYNPAIDIAYFPNTVGLWFWSSTPFVGDSYNQAWFVSFLTGDAGFGFKFNYNNLTVRLVRGGQ